MPGLHFISILIGSLMLTLFSSGGIVNSTTAFAEEGPDYKLCRLIEERIKSVSLSEELVCRGKIICAQRFVLPFYKERAYKPAWLSVNKLFPQATALISVIEKAPEEALRPEDYHLAQLKELTAKAPMSSFSGNKPDLNLLRDLDLLLTDAFFLLGAHLYKGRINPETVHPNWEIQRTPAFDFAAVLKKALEKDKITATLSGLAPPSREYQRMKKALATYRKLEETPETTRIPAGPSVKPGETDERIPETRTRLFFLGDMAKFSDSKDPRELDPMTVAALRRFQLRHGLTADGILGRKTISALNYPISDRVSQIEINMERWRWIPHDLGNEYLMVNTADFSLRLISGSDTLMEMRIVAGKPDRLTPVLSAKINTIVLNPYWHVPQTIAVKDILPKLYKNPGYLREQHIAVLESWREEATEISPELIDWHSVTPNNFRYKLRQDPGPKNSLGRIKFLFPNKFGVYLHDTPSRELFRRTARGFSSGCIRIEKPLDIAAYLLRNSSEWTWEAIEEQIKIGETRAIPVHPAMPIHLLYWTAWVDNNDIVQFREDIYQRDDCLKTALTSGPSLITGNMTKKHTPEDDCFGTYETTDPDSR